MQKTLISLALVLFLSSNAFSQQLNRPEIPTKDSKKQLIQPKQPEAERLLQNFELKIEKFQSFDYIIYLRNFRSDKMHMLKHTS